MNIAGLDIGTTGCKIVVYDEQACLKKTYYKEYDALHAQGRHEVSFDAIRDGVTDILAQAAHEFRLSALGVTSFGETFALLDEDDRVLAPSMLYTDPRGAEECAFLREKTRDVPPMRTGTVLHPMYSIVKLLWIKRHLPDVFARAKHVLLGQDFIVYILTGQAKIEYSLAARTAAFDIEKMCWVPEIFEAAGIDPNLFSEPVPTGTNAGMLCERAKKRLGIDYVFPVICAAHDQVAAMIGSGVRTPDRAMDGTGTVECIPVLMNERPADASFFKGGYSLVPYPGGLYACYAFSFTGGATLKWFRDALARPEYDQTKASGGNFYAEMDALLPGEPTGILALPHFAGAATPYMDTDAKAALVGLTLETTKADLYRALMEGTAYEIRLNIRTLEERSGQSGMLKELRATGGGASSDEWLQIKADILQTAITALSCPEVGAAGTAALAGCAVGAFDDPFSAAERMAPVRRVVQPNPGNAARYDALFERYRRLYGALRPLM